MNIFVTWNTPSIIAIIQAGDSNVHKVGVFRFLGISGFGMHMHCMNPAFTLMS